MRMKYTLREQVATRVVVPLAAPERSGVAGIDRLMPAFEIEGSTVTMITPQLSGVPRALPGPRVASLAVRRREIIAALDVLISGV